MLLLVTEVSKKEATVFPNESYVVPVAAADFEMVQVKPLEIVVPIAKTTEADPFPDETLKTQLSVPSLSEYPVAPGATKTRSEKTTVTVVPASGIVAETTVGRDALR